MDIVIYGSGGFGRETLQIINEINAASERCSLTPSPVNLLGFLDDSDEKVGSTVAGLPVHGDANWIRANPSVGVVLGVGSPRVKCVLVEKLRPLGALFPNIAHPSVLEGREVRIGEGCVICAGTVFTSDIVMGSFVTLNLGCKITHDDVVGDYVTMAPSCNIAGNVHVGEGTDLGTAVTAIPGVRIGSWSVIGAGAVITRDIPDHVTAVGIPAKIIKTHDPPVA